MNESCHLAYLYSSPLINGKVHLESVDFAKEKKCLCEALDTAKRKVKVQIQPANTRNLRTVCTMGCRALHYSGHGISNSLLFEDSENNIGRAKVLGVPELKGLFTAGGTASNVKIVFVSACYSEPIGKAFADAGVPHVVAVKSNQKLRDDAAQLFMNHFYLALLMGKKVKESFAIAVEIVKHDISDKSHFLLLPEEGNHNEAIFSDIPEGEWMNVSGPLPRYHIPSLPYLIGRNSELQDLLAEIVCGNKKMITLLGEHGIGKTTLAIAACHYLLERRVFEGIFFIELAELTKTPQTLLSLLASQFSCMSTCSSSPLSSPPSASSSIKVEHQTFENFCKEHINEHQYLLVFDGIDIFKEKKQNDKYLHVLDCLYRISFSCYKTKVVLTSCTAIDTKNYSSVILECVKKIEPLSNDDSLQLFCESIPRNIVLKEIRNANNNDDDSKEVDLSKTLYPILKAVGGIPKKVLESAQKLKETELFSLIAREYLMDVNDVWAWITGEWKNEVESIHWNNFFVALSKHFILYCQLDNLRSLDGLDVTFIKTNLKIHSRSSDPNQSYSENTPPAYIRFISNSSSPQTHYRSYESIDVVYKSKFLSFWRWFSAFEQLINMIRNVWIINQPHRIIHGVISQRRAEGMLESCHPGTFIIRISSLIGCLDIDYLNNDRTMSHLIIVSRPGWGFHLKPTATGALSSLHIFPSLEDLIAHIEALKYIYPNINKSEYFMCRDQSSRVSVFSTVGVIPRTVYNDKSSQSPMVAMN